MQTVVRRNNDPNIYLFAGGEWYYYDPFLPPLGGGAMGDVYRGYSCKDRRLVAVKRVKDCYANNPMIRARAKFEAGLQFRHPNLVEMLGYCEWGPTSGPIFILSNYVNGEDVDTYVKKLGNNPMRVENISNVICSVLDGLDFIHSKNVTHRDVKPSNIMIENGSNVRLMDLGIARSNGGTKFTANGFIGTPEYSAPEQMKRTKDGVLPKIDARTDIYELGITFYELLTGRNPMKCSTEAETLSKQMKDKLPADPKIPNPLMNVILKATEKEQSKRYQTAREFKQAILTALATQPSVWQRFNQWVMEHTILTAIIGMSLLSIIFVVLLLIIL